MEANEFVKEFGLEEAKIALIYCKSVVSGELFYKNIDVSINDLKRLVDSHKLVESFGGLRMSKYHLLKVKNSM